ncbi:MULTISPECIES: hypothetical protein [Kribbella]
MSENEEHAVSVLEVALGIDLTEVELGEDYVLEPSDEMLKRCEDLVASGPSPEVLSELVAGLRNSYHLRRVHRLLAEMGWQVLHQLRADVGTSGVFLRVAERLGQAFKYGAGPADLDLVLEMCSDTNLTFEGDIEDVRNYWFDSLAKIRDDRVGEFCRSIIDADLGRWQDLRLGSSIRALAKVWDGKTDPIRVGRIAEEHPDSFIRKVARQSLAKH